VRMPGGPRERAMLSDEGEVSEGLQHQQILSWHSEQSIGRMKRRPLDLGLGGQGPWW
jgi:hypothetical protein